MSQRVVLILAALVAALLVAAAAFAEPQMTAEDDRIFAKARTQGHKALSPEEFKKLAFWIVYGHYRSALHPVYPGAIIMDDFEGDALSLSVREQVTDRGMEKIEMDGEWRVWNSDPDGIAITQEGGVLSIKGKSTVPGGLNFNGLVGNVYGNTDLVAIAEMKAVAPALDYPGMHFAMFHLCGSSPDIFNELCYGRTRDGEMGWTHHYVGAPAEIGASEWRPHAPVGDEAERFYPIKLEHVAETEQSRAWYKVEGEWREVGGPRTVIMSTAKVELKVNVPSGDAEVECYFDNCRVYPRPETHPVRFVVYPSRYYKHGPKGDASAEREKTFSVPGVKVEILVNGAEKACGSDVTDALGRAAITLPADVDYPAAGRVRIALADGNSWEAAMRFEGLEGLYPDSVWSICVNDKEIAGDDTWWHHIPGAPIAR